MNIFNLKKEKREIFEFPSKQKITKEDVDKYLENTSATDIIIPEGVIEISTNAFKERSIKSIKLPTTLKKIEFMAFWGCNNLEEVDLKEGLEYISGAAFSHSGLKKVVIPESVKRIEFSAFSNCKKLEYVKLPENLDVLEPNTFNFSAIKEINIPSKIKIISRGCLAGCYNINKLFIPQNVEIIETSAINYCTIKSFHITQNVKFNLDISKKFPIKFDTFEIDVLNKKNELISHKLKLKSRKIIKMYRNDDGLFFLDENKNEKLAKYDWNINIINKDGYRKISYLGLMSLTDKSQSKIQQYVDMENGIKIVKWIEGIEKRKLGGQEVYLPEAYIMNIIPQKDKDIARFYIMESFYHDMLKLGQINDEESKKSFLKICYMLGLFSDIKQDSERAKEFIKTKLLPTLSEIDMVRLYREINIDFGYNREFSKFYVENYQGANTFIINDQDETSRMINEFKVISDIIKNKKRKVTTEEIVRHLSSQKYKYRPGNEMLAALVSNYSESYDQKQFDKLQSIFESGRRLAANEGKKIAQTVDKKTFGATYLWSPADNPINLVLGHKDKASCCAKLGGAGEKIMVAAVESPVVQNLILFDKYRTIIGKATAYYNIEQKYILFNNAEINPDWLSRANELEKNDIVDSILRAVNDQVKALNSTSEEPVITRIHMGMLRNDLEKQIKAKQLRIEKKDMLTNYTYGFYHGDANDTEAGQVVLYEESKGVKK